MKTGDRVQIVGTKTKGVVNDAYAAVPGYVIVELPSLGKCRMFHSSALRIVKDRAEKGGAK